MDENSRLFGEILRDKAIITLFQPIFDLRNADIIGYEALSRGPENTPFFSPVRLIEQADRENSLWELERIFREKALAAARELGLKNLLFLNVDPNIVNDTKFVTGFTKQYIEDHGLLPEMIVFEITERSAIENYKSFRSTMMHYHEQGYKTAIDDMGAGYSNLAVISKIKPHFIKIDMEIVRDVDKDSFKQAIIKSFVWLANLTNTTLIAEGIETMPEARTLISLGVHAGQGYLLGRPAPGLTSIDPRVKREILDFNSSSTLMHSFASKYIGEICEQVDAFEADTNCVAVKQYFTQHDAEGACVLSNGHIVGLIMLNKLDAALSAQYGFSLYSQKPVSNVMDSACLIVDYFTPINTVSEMAMTRPRLKIYDNIIVTKNLKYMGIVSVITLLKHSSDIERSFALELNPLTGLPGNAQINKVLFNTIAKGNECCVLYMDLDNFKVYNDAYGFKQGDAIIKMTRDIVCRNIKDKYTFSSFIGHIGGDDFLAIVNCSQEDCAIICDSIIKDFNHEVLQFISDRDIANGCIMGRARNSKEMICFPITSMTIAGVCGVVSGFETPDRLSYQLSKIKSSTKALGGGTYVIENVGVNGETVA